MSAIVADLIAYTGAGILIGYLLWDKVGLGWWVLLLTTLLGFCAGIYRMYQRSQVIMEKLSGSEKDNGQQRHQDNESD